MKGQSLRSAQTQRSGVNSPSKGLKAQSLTFWAEAQGFNLREGVLGDAILGEFFLARARKKNQNEISKQKSRTQGLPQNNLR